MPVAMLRNVTEGDIQYTALCFLCPGCQDVFGGAGYSGLHMLPVNTTVKTPQWDFDGNLEKPTLSPSILTKGSVYTGPDTSVREYVCHSFLRAGVFEFLGDCTHKLVGQFVPLPELPDWVTKEFF